LSSLGAPRSTPFLTDNGHKGPSADEIDACDGNLIVAIIEVAAGNTIPTENHLILSKDLFGLNPKQLEKPTEN
jgi:hypothetical protein